MILHITNKYVRFGFTCDISLSISEAGRMIEYTILQTTTVDKKQNKNKRFEEILFEKLGIYIRLFFLITKF